MDFLTVEFNNGMINRMNVSANKELVVFKIFYKPLGDVFNDMTEQ